MFGIQAGSVCSTMSCTAAVPLYSLTARRYTQRILSGSDVCMIEANRLEARRAFAQRELQVLVLEQALVFHGEGVVEQRRREALAPYLAPDAAGGGKAHVAGFERAVALDGALKIGRRDQLAGNCLERRLEARQIAFADGKPGGGGVAAETQQQAGLALGYQVERVAQMQAGNRTARALEFAIAAAAGEGDHRTMALVFHARGEQSDHTLVPLRIEQRETGALGDLDALHGERRLVLHVRFDRRGARD